MANKKKHLRGHWIPFILWVGVMGLLQVLDPFLDLPRRLVPVVYAAKALVCAGVLLYYKPWRLYGDMRAKDWLPALFAGSVVAVIWILPETPFVNTLWPEAQALYHRWFIFPFGRFPGYFELSQFPALPFNHASLAFSPREAGWGLVVLKLIGSAGVIAVIEEYFFRGFLYRWIRNPAVTAVELGRYDPKAFWIVVTLFAVEHDRWLVGLLAGVIYGWLTVRSGNVAPAVVAHVTTNLLLGIYVIVSGQYGFW